MILEALHEHYYRLLEDTDSGVAPPGFSPAKVSHALVLSKEGELLDILPLMQTDGRKSVPILCMVPEQEEKRASAIRANILCDNASYTLGLERNKQGEYQTSEKRFKDFALRNLAFLKAIDSPGAKALRTYLSKWDSNKSIGHPIIQKHLDGLLSGSNLVFKLDGQLGYIHDEEPIREAWRAFTTGQAASEQGQCLVTGEILPIARIHPALKGIVGAQPSGASIVSFNKDSFTSYGKSQSFNAPVSEKAAFAYGTALNYLLSNSLNRVRFTDTTLVFWADKKGRKLEEQVFRWSLDPIEADSGADTEERRLDAATVAQAKSILENIRTGLPTGDNSFDRDTRCFILGLAPNAARLSIRFWEVSSFGDLLSKVAQHYEDLRVVGLEHYGRYIAPWRLLKSVAVQEETKTIPPLLEGQLLKAILTGQTYPKTLYNAALTRSRIEGVNAIRAGIIKACLLRKSRLNNQNEEAMITVGLDENNNNVGYRLGRLFSLLEKAQKDALGSALNATIRDRYFGAASATPGAVFPLLLRLSRHHISKAEYGNATDYRIQQVIQGLAHFPAHLNMDEQGQFILGYYHQNQANYTKSEDTKSEKRKVDEHE